MGVFYLAWVDASETTFNSSHYRNDADVLSLELAFAEGHEPVLTVEIQNPRIGLLATGRKQWAWLSFDNGTTVTPLFFGRLVALPENPNGEKIKVEFIAHPVDIDTQKADLAATLRTAPYYDPLWLSTDERANPDSVLVARNAAWCIDPVTHELTITSTIFGEDGTVDLGPDTFPGKTDIAYGTAPASRCIVTASASWQQQGAGYVDVMPIITAGFGGKVQSYTGEGLRDSWPTPGTGLGSGWTVFASAPNVVIGSPGTLGTTGELGQDVAEIRAQFAATFNPFPADSMTGGGMYRYPVWTFAPTLTLRFDANRTRKEDITFTLPMDVQAISTDPGADDTITFDVNSSDVDQPIDPPDSGHPNGTIPIGSVSRRSFLPTDRGRQALENLIAIARAKLLARARVVEISAECAFEAGLSFSMRKNVRIEDHRIPGGAAVGKLVEYSLVADGSGLRRTRFKIGCTIGTDATLSPTAGTGDYVGTGYVDAGYQTISDAVNLLDGTNVGYSDSYTAIPPNDDGVDLLNPTAATAVVACNVYNSAIVQKPYLTSYHPSEGELVADIESLHTRIDLTMTPMTGNSFTTTYPVTTTTLVAPQMIDLAAASS